MKEDELMFEKITKQFVLFVQILKYALILQLQLSKLWQTPDTQAASSLFENAMIWQ